MSAGGNSIHVALGAEPAADAFSLSVVIGGVEALETIAADAPGVFSAPEHPFASEALIAEGWIIGFLLRGPLRMPVVMPFDGWIMASAPDATRVEHGTPLFRILRASKEISY